MKKISTREVIHVAAMVGVLVLGVRCGTNEESDHEHSLLTFESGLLVKDRSALQVCVQMDPALEGARSQELLQTLERDLTAVKESHPDWQKARFDRAAPRVVLGCPGGAWPEAKLEKGGVVGPGVTRHPSPFRTFIYVLDDAKANAVLGDLESGQMIAELMWEDEDSLVEVSSALIVRASVLGTSSFRELAFPQGLGLRPTREVAEPASTDFIPKP
jgi:hypothetical protein